MSKLLIQEANTASKWFIRSLKKGDWLWLMLAVIIASTTVTVVKQLGESVQQSMLRKASESLGADFVIRSSQPINQRWQQQAQEMGLQTSEMISVVTMALTLDAAEEAQFQLVRLNGISQTQPLRGAWNPSTEIPFTSLDKDSVWVDPSLFALLPLQANSEITLGTKAFKLAGSLKSPAVVNPMTNIAPAIYMQLEELNQIGLMGPGSRVNYQLSVAGDKAALQTFAQQVAKADNPAWQTLSAEAPSEDLGRSLDTAWLFLDLSALSAVLVAGMSILIASRFYLSRWKQSIALMRAFGAHNSKMNRLFALQMSWIAMLSSLIGAILGYLISLALAPILANYFDPLVLASPIKAMGIGFLSGVLVLWTFAWQAFYSTVNVSPMQVLKAVPNQKQNLHWLISFLFLIGLISLMLDLNNLGWIVLGILLSSLVLFAVAELLVKLLFLLQAKSRGWLRVALSNITKEPGLVKIQLVSVGMVLFVLMLMTFVRQDLMTNWQASLPQDTPNAFAINIQTDQKPQVDEILQEVEQKIDAAMVRGRLIAVNGKAIDIEALPNERAKRLLRREANIAVMPTLPDYNQITEQINVTEAPFVSVEKDIAELFGMKLGDFLDFEFSGQTYRYQVDSFREVQWQSFKLNFFFIIEPDASRALPISYISNFVLPIEESIQTSTNSTADEGKTATYSENYTKQLAEQTPGVLLIDVRRILNQIQEIMQQAGWAVSALYIFTLLASFIVLFTATLASQQSRIQNWLLLRTIGASNSEIFKIGLTEFFFLGLLAGVFAASLAQFASLAISLFLLKIPPQIDLTLWVSSVLAGASIFFFIGLVTQWSYLQKPPRELKRYLNSE